MRVHAILLAGGSGDRFGAEMPKQFVRLAGEPILLRSLRGEYTFTPDAPRTGAEAAAAGDFDLEQLLHLSTLNRGILLTPFHNMALMSPATTEDDVDRHTEVFGELLGRLVGPVQA